ncbi:bifunctional nuclease family protein [Nigerium massiliense]|uniref:bifunctional nuclease family protein n=1 Tax=Nigerium massiliense TaxID=1522317 RepID=UPI000694FDB8|nr:bifunctional nuclease family protein [Nigerium massiliense]
MIQLLYSDVRFTDVGADPVLLLREAEGTRVLPVWITASAGTAILSALEPSEPDHPSVHDVFIDALATLDGLVDAVRITGHDDAVFDADLQVNGQSLPCRLSDGVALALRCGAPIYVTEAVLDEASIDPDATPDAGASLEDDNEQVEQFREFLDQVNPDDFEGR